ncbi:unnamed protein product [Diabrotica balteata]|uniref:CTNNB1 binding N-teminal domain-containing protein n=1 Tax=Diabrotica balteata TaxID=107213 RepID=A0A9N9XLA0_DIABA|nr:unnamed protein product [Diabrotica balteata]
MPHVSSSGGDDLGSTDEVKVFKDEGDGEDEKRSSENLTEEKSSLIDLTESEEKSGTGNYHPTSKHVQRPDHSPVFVEIWFRKSHDLASSNHYSQRRLYHHIEILQEGEI